MLRWEYYMRYSAVLLVCASLAAQEPRRDAVVVTGSYQPVPLKEADRAVRLFDVREIALTAASLVDFLKLDPSLDVRQRAPGGVQADLSIRGSTFGQTLVLVDGVRMNDAQSGHHNMDLPVSMETAARVEILRGAGSTLYGSDAVGGVVNVITEPPKFSEIRLRAAVGSFGVNQESGSMAGVLGGLTQQLSFSRDFSSGFREGRDYRSLALASTTYWRGSAVTLALSDRPFGADQFYGNYNSWERTKTWLASARQKLDDKTDVSFAFRRHTRSVRAHPRPSGGVHEPSCRGRLPGRAAPPRRTGHKHAPVLRRRDDGRFDRFEQSGRPLARARSGLRFL